MKARSALPPITIEQIATRARELWQRKGAPAGRDLEFWLQAENELVFEREQAAYALERIEGTRGPGLPPAPPEAGGAAPHQRGG
ncbi:MAG TPA: DUF2934 domain-containing protein [Opitutaceae bacterium]